MLRSSREVFNMYMCEEGFSESKVSLLRGVYKKLEKWEEIKNKELREMTKEEIIDMCSNENQDDKEVCFDSIGRKRKAISTKVANRSYLGFLTRLEAINSILRWVNSNVTVSMKDFNTEKVLEQDNDRYYTKEEIQDLCDILINPQDKFIIYGLFCGICGKAYSDLLELKISDVDMVNRVLTTKSGKTISIDNYLYDIIKDCQDETFGGFYYKYFKASENEVMTTKGYKLEMSSEYIIKSKPYSKNNQGRSPMTLNGIQSRFKRLSEALEMEISGTDIVRSGIMHIMYQLEENKGISWSHAKIDKWVKENGISAQSYKLYRTYHMKYHKKDKPAS